jgi:hypothetical protein
MSPFLAILIFLYAGLILVHLFCCLFHMEYPRMFTKIFLMPFLSLIYYYSTPKEKFSKIIFAAIIFGFLGDVNLLCDNYFPLILLGILFFFLGHLLYTINFVIETGLRNYKKYFIFFIGISLVYAAYARFCVINLKEGFERGDLLIPGICYIFLLAITNIASGIYAYTHFNIYAILAHFGTFSFTISDFILARKMFYENKKYYQVILMATYILAQTLICFGMSNKKIKAEIEKKKII